MKLTLAILIAFFTVSYAYAGATTSGDYYVTSDDLNVRLTPDKSGKITNTLYKRQKVEVFEVKGNWARISRYYDGGVEGGLVMSRVGFLQNISLATVLR